MEWIYPILGKQKCLPFYLSGIGIAEPEYHVIREEGLEIGRASCRERV